MSLNIAKYRRFSFYDADFGWGKPAPVILNKNLITLMDAKDGEGIEAIVSLEKEEIKWQCLSKMRSFFPTIQAIVVKRSLRFRYPPTHCFICSKKDKKKNIPSYNCINNDLYNR